MIHNPGQFFSFLADRQSSTCATGHRLLITNRDTWTVVSGTVIAALAVSEVATTYTGVRFHSASGAPANVDTARVGVWDATGANLLAQSASQHVAYLAAGTSQQYTWAFTSPLALAARQTVRIGIGFHASSGTALGTIRGTTGLLKSDLMLAPQLAWNETTLAGSGASLPATMTGDPTVAVIPKLELY